MELDLHYSMVERVSTELLLKFPTLDPHFKVRRCRSRCYRRETTAATAAAVATIATL